MNIDNIKKEFPIFDEKIQNNDLVYLDSANSSQKPKIVKSGGPDLALELENKGYENFN